MTTYSKLIENTDVLIVGAGVSGLYSAWRLLEQDNKRKVIVLDRLNRVGVRLDSDLVTIPNPYDDQETLVKEEEEPAKKKRVAKKAVPTNVEEEEPVKAPTKTRKSKKDKDKEP
jgi:flavin-dependent dehydrogenase